MIFTIAEVNRAFYEKLRLALVFKGYLPDIAIYLQMEQDLIATGVPELQAKKQSLTAYENAKKALADAIEVFGVGDYSGRGEYKGSKFVIDRLTFDKGKGSFKSYFYESEEGNTKQYELPRFTRNIIYQISYSTNSARLDSIMSQVMLSCFGVEGFLFGIKEDGTASNKSFQYYEINNADNSDGNYIDRYVRYEAVNLYLDEPQLVNDNVVPMKVFLPNIVPFQN